MDQIALDKFIDTLIAEKKSPSVNDQNRPQIKEHLRKSIMDAINAYLISILDDDSQEELSVLLDKNATDDEIDEFFIQRIPNLTEEITNVLMDFRKGYLLASADQPIEDQNQPKSS